MENFKETVIVCDGKVIARCYRKEELIEALKEVSGVVLECIPVSTLVNSLEEEAGGVYGPESKATSSYNECGYIYKPVFKKGDSNKTMNEHGYHRSHKSKEAEKSVWNDMLRSGWFYDETGIELFSKTSLG